MKVLIVCDSYAYSHAGRFHVEMWSSTIVVHTQFSTTIYQVISKN